MWYRLKNKNRQGEVVEYSTDFNFFVEHQVMITKSGGRHQIQSRLESKVFRHEVAVLRQTHDFSPKETLDMIRLIHQEILEGKHGQGELVN